jgi:hypothetical protein
VKVHVSLDGNIGVERERTGGHHCWLAESQTGCRLAECRPIRGSSAGRCTARPPRTDRLRGRTRRGTACTHEHTGKRRGARAQTHLAVGTSLDLRLCGSAAKDRSEDDDGGEAGHVE